VTDPVSLAVALAALVIALWAGWASLPTPPALDAERWFKVILATLLRGATEARDGTDADWERDVLAFVPFHPDGSRPEVKIEAPERVVLTGRPGERALVDELKALATAAERSQHLYRRSTAGRVERLSDPADLGPDYDLERWLGAGASWNQVADLGAGDGTAARDAAARAVPARWIVVGHSGAAPDVAGALVRRGAVRVPPDAALDVAVADHLTRPEERAVIVAFGGATGSVVAALADHAGLRDRVLAVVAIGSDLGGADVAARIRDDVLDLEVRRRLHLFAVQWFEVDRGETVFDGVPLSRARFPEPGRVAGGAPVVDALDLGPLPPVASLPVDLVADALILLVSGWIRAHAH
jgi:hypothetical protein